MSGGCITRGWSKTLEVSEGVIDLLSERPELMGAFERLHDQHGRKLPRFMPWGADATTTVSLSAGISVSIITRCSKARGLHSSCSFQGRAKRR